MKESVLLRNLMPLLPLLLGVVVVVVVVDDELVMAAMLLFLGAFAIFFHFLRICWSLTISLILLDFLESIEVENMLQPDEFGLLISVCLV